jgi:hypothetical protein
MGDAEKTGWLRVSTEGFAAFNAARPPEHLIKELVQNSLDALGDNCGEIHLTVWWERGLVRVQCKDTGGGLRDLGDLQVLYLTHKTDSHLKRGRFGRGFKEVVSVCAWARVMSGGKSLDFIIENGRKLTRSRDLEEPIVGTVIDMAFEWDDSAAAALEAYFARVLPPAGVTLVVNGEPIERRAPTHSVTANLPTEIHDAVAHAWRKRVCKTTIDLVPVRPGEEPFLYEMGIPVASLGWTEPFHADVQQRVPMNPNRDAFASGYAQKIHSACLPALVPEMDSAKATADWVAPAALRCAPEVQKAVVTTAFGANAARAVPPMGKRDYTDDAQRSGAQIIQTRQMSEGFRELVKAHLPTAKEVVEKDERRVAEEAAARRFDPAVQTVVQDENQMWMERRGGPRRVMACLQFAAWFCQQLVNTLPPEHRPVVLAAVAYGMGCPSGRERFLATWSPDGVVTLAFEEDSFWRDPTGATALGILIHEAAHAMNMHHGRTFVAEIERLAGVAAAVMFEKRDVVIEHLRRIAAA